MQMNTLKDNADFLHLFSEEKDGLKFLTHDLAGLDYIEYVYRCQQLVLKYDHSKSLCNGLYELVRGFVFGPEWVDYKGDTHSSFASSEEFARYYDETGKHPLNNPVFEKEIEDFRNSIRFRSGRLDLFIRGELKGEFPELDMAIPACLKGADMYVMTGPVREAIRLILKGMQEYPDRNRVVFSFFEDKIDGKLLKSTLSITQVGSYPSHTLSRDMSRLSEGNGGTFGTIKEHLKGLCEWEVVSKWPDCDTPCRWRILRDETVPEVSPASVAEGFTHIISIYHKP